MSEEASLPQQGEGLKYTLQNLLRAMVEKGDCMDEYNQKESARREKTKKAIKLD